LAKYLYKRAKQDMNRSYKDIVILKGPDIEREWLCFYKPGYFEYI